MYICTLDVGTYVACLNFFDYLSMIEIRNEIVYESLISQISVPASEEQ